jgi:hypothetical protein
MCWLFDVEILEQMQVVTQGIHALASASAKTCQPGPVRMHTLHTCLGLHTRITSLFDVEV